MNQIVGTWIGPSNERYAFDNKGIYALIYPHQPKMTRMYSVCGNTLTLRTTYKPEDKEKITLTFSDNGNKVRFDWIGGTKRLEDGATSICLRREEK